MTKSMTGFASATGAGQGYSWTWEIRSVNARGMDARLRVPDWIDGLEALLKPAIQKVVARGNVSLTLKVSRDQSVGITPVDPKVLRNVLATIKLIENSALTEHDIQLAPTSAVQILGMRELGGPTTGAQDVEKIRKILVAEFSGLLTAFDSMRKNEGKALQGVLIDQLSQIFSLTTQAARIAKAREKTTAQSLRENLAKILDNTEGADPDRVAQELAIITLKSDVTEEIDRLHAHVDAARELLNSDGVIGRKLDFLAQEFNREANTLCSKAQAKDLTRVGLELKAAIEQMREQVQNVE